MVRILLIPNVAYHVGRNDLADDSYLEFLNLTIELMQRKRDDLFWYIVIPRMDDRNENEVKFLRKKLDYPNTYFIEMDIPIRPLNHIHFNVNELEQKLSLNDYPIDLVFCHVPELVRSLKLFFKSVTNLTPSIMGYLHLFELPKINWNGVFEYNIFGMTEMDSCFLNTSYQKQMVHEEARKIFSSSVCGKLHENLEVLPPVIIPKNIRPNKKGSYEKIIVWNHDVDKKDNFLEFEKTILALRKKRDDFKVWVPKMKSSHKLTREYRWITIGKSNNRREFLDKMRTCCVGISPKGGNVNLYNSTIEGNSCGIPFVMFNEPYYLDINSSADFYKTRKELISFLNKYLDESDYRNQMAGQAIGNLITKYNMNRKVNVINKRINLLLKSIRPIRSKKTNEIIKIIKQKKRISHRELLGPKYLNWDSETKFDGYRKAILNTKGINEVRKVSKGKKYSWKSYYEYLEI